MTLQAELTNTYNDFHTNGPPEVTATIRRAAVENKATFNLSSTIQVGDILPPFDLPNSTGQRISSTSLLSHSPILLTFYRGSWCPFCNLTLRAFQSALPSIAEKGVSFLAITAELPDTSFSTVETNALEFPVLSDVGNAYARQLGLVFKQAEDLRGVFRGAGIDWQQRYGNDDFEVAVPATLLVDRMGRVRNLFVDTDYSKRLEPETALEWIDALNAEAKK